MWDFSFVIPAFFILLILFAFYFSLPRLKIRRNLFFVQIVAVELMTITLDILASLADNDPFSYPLFFVHFLNSAFFILFFIRFYLFFLFTISLLNIDLRNSIPIQVLTVLPMALGIFATIASFGTGWIYYIDESGYNSGVYNAYIHIFLFIYIIYSFMAVFMFGRHRRRRERFWMLVYNLILLVGVILRILLPHLLLLDTFCLMAILVIYLAFENPEFYLDVGGTVFNSQAFRDLIEETRGKSQQRLFGVVMHNYYELRDIYGSHQTDEGVRMIAGFLVENFYKYSIFYYRKGRFIILGDSGMDFERMSALISERFTRPWRSGNAELYMDACFITMELGEEIVSPDDVFNTIVLAFNKSDSRNIRMPYFVTSNELIQTRRETLVKRSLEYAVENDRMEVYLQPLIDASTGKLIGAEALSRVRDMDGEIIPPGEFIPIAERSGRINELGEQVLDKACAFFREHDLKALGLKWINVNLSPIQFMRSDLTDRLEAILKKYELGPECIHLEITEESMVDDGFFQKQMQTILEKGFKFVLDDYGTGYSNLTRLKKCPFINIKLDMSLVWDYFESPDDILPTMIKAFKSMNFTITAEGIEGQEMAEAMKRIGCDYLQGYYYSKPIPVDEFVQKYSRVLNS